MIYHVATKGEWENSKGDSYSPSSFAKERFIHCCTSDQLQGVMDRYFRGAKNLYLLKLDEKLLKFPLKYEPSTNNELFPHIYGEINKDAVVNVDVLNPDSEF